MPELRFLKRLPYHLVGRKKVMPPLANHRTVFQQQQSRIAPYYGLERRLVRVIERILSPCHILPARNGGIATCRKAIELIMILYGIFIDHVYVAEVGIISLFQMRRDEQEGISLVYRFREIIARLHIRDCEIVDRRHISLAYLL